MLPLLHHRQASAVRVRHLSARSLRTCCVFSQRRAMLPVPGSATIATAMRATVIGKRSCRRLQPLQVLLLLLLPLPPCPGDVAMQHPQRLLN